MEKNKMKSYMKEDKMVKDCQAPKKVYSQEFDKKPLDYMERQNKKQEKEAEKLRKQKFQGRY